MSRTRRKEIIAPQWAARHKIARRSIRCLERAPCGHRPKGSVSCGLTDQPPRAPPWGGGAALAAITQRERPRIHPGRRDERSRTTQAQGPPANRPTQGRKAWASLRGD